MKVYLSNSSGVEPGMLMERFPGRVGWLAGPSRKIKLPIVREIPWACDNDRFADFQAGRDWDEARFVEMLEGLGRHPYPPLWVAAPDEIADREGTLKSWDIWWPRLVAAGVTPAIVVQDGMTMRDVEEAFGPLPMAGPEPVVFVGGTTRWKWNSLASWARNFPRVHVGRVNSLDGLRYCHRFGVESCDGTGWFRGRGAAKGDNQLMRLVRYLSGETDFDLSAGDPLRELLKAA